MDGLVELWIPCHLHSNVCVLFIGPKNNPIPSKLYNLIFKGEGVNLQPYLPNQIDIFMKFVCYCMQHWRLWRYLHHICFQVIQFNELFLLFCFCFVFFTSDIASLFSSYFLHTNIVFCYTFCRILHEVFLLESIILIFYS